MLASIIYFRKRSGPKEGLGPGAQPPLPTPPNNPPLKTLKLKLFGQGEWKGREGGRGRRMAAVREKLHEKLDGDGQVGPAPRMLRESSVKKLRAP